MKITNLTSFERVSFLIVRKKLHIIAMMICQVKETPSSNICGKVYVRKDSSTGNAISHLRATHNITQAGKVKKEIF